jgi:hypothetical protein
MARPRVADGRDGLQIRCGGGTAAVAGGQPTRGSPTYSRIGAVLWVRHPKEPVCYEC